MTAIKIGFDYHMKSIEYFVPLILIYTETAN